MTEFMNLVTTSFLNFGSGVISRLSALWRRDIGWPWSFWFRHGRALPGHPCLFVNGVPTDAKRPKLLRPFGSILGPALLAVFYALGVEDAANDVVAHARKVLDAATADHHDRMLLQVMALARDVADHFERIRKPHLGDLAQRRVRLLRRRRVDARAHAPLLRALLHRRHLAAGYRCNPRLANKLIDRRHAALSNFLQ